MLTWAGLSAIASSIGRRTHCRIQGQDLYPNLYIFLIGRPGVGKSNAAYAVRRIVTKVHSIKLSAEGISKRALFGELERAQVPANLMNPLVGMHCSLYVHVEEFGTFVHPQDNDFMTALARLYDCRSVFEYKTQHMGEHHIENACLNILGCCTRSYIREAWQKSVLEQGFPARIIIAYSDEIVKRELFTEGEEESDEQKALFEALVHDLDEISRLSGQFIWEKEAQEYLKDWYRGGMQPRPADRRLEDYCNRRLAHCVKLAMLCSASQSDDLVISSVDVGAAQALLLQAEQTMGGALEILGANPLSAEMDLAVKFIRGEYVKKKGKAGVAEYKVRQFLFREVPPQHINFVIESLTSAPGLRAEGGTGSRVFYPLQSSLNEENPQEAS